MTHARPSRYSTAVLVLSLLTVGTAIYVSPIQRTASNAGASTGGPVGHHAFRPIVSPVAIPAVVPAKPAATSGADAASLSSYVASSSRHVAATPVPAPAPAPKPTTTTTTTSTTTTSTTTTTTPVAVYKPPVPSPATMAALENPAVKYFGVANENIPFSTSAFSAFDNEVGKAPSAVEWFDGWDTSFPAQGVVDAWQHGALPIITWESMPSIDPVVQGQNRSADPAYSLSNIINGLYDPYILKFAAAVAATDLPVVIRFDQEMNGNWYPWSENANGNHPGQFAQMWQHVWNLFNEVGANQDVIWMWVPNRVDKLGSGATPASEFYPGDKYVNWMGMDGYYRAEGDATTFAFTFGATLTQLKAVSTTKPIFLAEVGSIQTGSTGDDLSAAKAAWTANLFAGMAADPQIVGFAWFDNVATNSVNGQLVQDNWPFDSDTQALQAFETGVQSSQYSAGLMPDTSSS